MAYFVHIVCSFLMHILSTFVPIFCIFCLHSSAYLCIYSAYFAVWNLYNGTTVCVCVPAYFRHSFTYFLVFLHIYCIFTVFCAYICISLIVSAYFVQCISQFCRSFPVPFLFHFTAKAADQQFIASKHTHSSCQANLLPARAQGKAFTTWGPAAPGTQSVGLQITFPSISSNWRT